MDMFALVAIVTVLLLWVIVVAVRAGWYRRLRYRWLAFKIAYQIYRLRKSADDYDSPQQKLKRARKAAETLRLGYWVNYNGMKAYLHAQEYQWDIPENLKDIVEALEAGFSYSDIGTTKEEMIGFRNGEAHKASARLQIALARTLVERPPEDAIIALAKDGGFSLEEVGTSAEELAGLSHEYVRRVYHETVEQFREWATRVSDVGFDNPEKFAKTIARVRSPQSHNFSYEELGTSESEFNELMRLGRRRRVEKWIDYIKNQAEKGSTLPSSPRSFLDKALKKAGLSLADFGLTEEALTELEQKAQRGKSL